MQTPRKYLSKTALYKNGYGNSMYTFTFFSFQAHATVLYQINCIPINCKNGSGSVQELQNHTICFEMGHALKMKQRASVY